MLLGCGAAALIGCPFSDAYFVDPDYQVPTGAGGSASDSGPAGMGGAMPAMGGAMPGMGGGTAGAVDASADNANDECPNDSIKTMPGRCGCGIPESALCLVHRYTFDGTGTALADSAGVAQGTAVNCSQNSGGVTLAGTTNQYVMLPSGIVSALGSGTIEVWATWATTGGTWQRIFDFGSNNAAGTAGLTYLFLTPRAIGTQAVQLTYSEAGSRNETSLDTTTMPRAGVRVHYAAVVDVTAAKLSLYADGVLLGAATGFTGSLSHLDDVNNWLGRSQFSTDAYLVGTIHELRIYSTARTAAQIAAAAAAGPDVLPSQ